MYHSSSKKSSQIGYQLVNNSKLALEVLTIPYKNSLFEMQIILPKDVRSMKSLEGSMRLSGLKDLNPSDPDFFNVFSEDHRVKAVDFIEEVYLKMPTFKIKTDWDAAEPLQKLGVKRVFSENADLEGISNAAISVSRIEHTSMLELTKEGTEGAAATAVEVVLFATASGKQKDIVVDRPFIFVVQDRENKIPVLVGKITDPTKI